MEHKSQSIFINPKFKNAHINPNFLSSSIQVHINPKFMVPYFAATHQNIVQQLPVIIQQNAKPPLEPKPLIKNTKRKLIRVPVTPPAATASSTATSQNVTRPSFVPSPVPAVTTQQNLIKISKTKLVRASDLIKCQQKENEIIKKTTESIIKSKKIQQKAAAKRSIYKLDRREDPNMKKKKVVSTYTIRRMSSSDGVTSRKVIMPIRKMQIGQKLISINGVVYKSTSNKLQRSGSSEMSVKTPSEQVIVIRGEKFTMDPSGTKLRRDSNSGNLNLSKIFIGGMTYKANQDGSYERLQVSNRLTASKTKSISFLTKTNLRKSNMICAIYRRLGKCLAYANGRCSMIHDPRYVIVCPSFLRNACKNEKCLLSHNANLHKMPVCKYYLQGLCTKQSQCLYLHKKLTDNTKICAEFLKGYCPLADNCDLLHDHPPSEQRDRKKYSIVKQKSNKDVKQSKETMSSEKSRYEADSQPSTSDSVPRRKKLGSLPAYIPL